MDLITLLQICRYSNDEERTTYFNERNIDMKSHEILTVRDLIVGVKNGCGLSNDVLSLNTDNFWLGFKIPQIGEEFDLIRFGFNYNVNIELKSDCDVEKMTRQLLRKKYYLKFLEIPTKHFIFSSDTKKLYQLNDSYELNEFNFTDFWQVIISQKSDVRNKFEIDKLFNPANYLISPFNTTDRFINTEYFLTNHQDKIKREIFKKIDSGELLFMIEGVSGTGKTLLVYDLIKSYKSEGKKILTIHTGKLNEGHLILNDDYDWNISPVKTVLSDLNNDLDLVVVDESQRLDEKINSILEFCLENKIPCIFSLDKNQCLHNNEINRNIREKLGQQIKKENSYKLKEKIRSNKELSDFIKLFNKIPVNDVELLENADSNIKVKYFDTKCEALSYVNQLKISNWKHLTYSNSLYTVESLDNLVVKQDENPHNVIGQEFEKVVVMIDDNFAYRLNERKTTYNLSGNNSSYYHIVKMLFQNVTRARKEVCLVIFNNPDFFKKVSGILEKM